LYLPADGYVPVERAKLAVTIHDVYKLEPPVPHENRLNHYQDRLKHWAIYKRVAKRADRIFTVSQFSASRIMYHLKVPAERIEIVYNGVSEAFFEPRTDIWERLRIEFKLEAGKYFVYSGGLKAKKNGAGIVAAWSKIEQRKPEYRLVALGHHDSKFLHHAQQTLINAVYPRRLTDEEMAALLRHSTALFFPSFYEGFGIPVVEAMAAGTMAVISDIPALRELGQDVAFYADPHDAAAMAHAIEVCIAANSERTHRVAAGRKHAELFKWNACVRRLRAALN
jgi:glycosyltransferase involved in cell wall biosynthesis